MEGFTMSHRQLIVLAALAALTIPALVRANARLISVVPTDGGCVSGPTGPSVQFWDIEPGRTYVLTINNVTDCANAGTDPTINVRVNSSGTGNINVVATRVVPGTYKFTYTMPANGACTFPIFYCTTPGQNNTGTKVNRNDGAKFQAHLRAAAFATGCTNTRAILGGDCGLVPTLPGTWGKLKGSYR
jgi:hypothetical protein